MSVVTRKAEGKSARSQGSGPVTPPLPRRWSLTPFDLQLLVGGVGVLIGGMWIRHGGASLLGNQMGIIAVIGQLTALYGTFLALVGILLLSRAPWIDQVVGSDEAARLHRLSGFAAVWLLVAHTVASTAALVSSGGIPNPVQIWNGIVDFTLHQQGGLGATVAIVLFILVAVVSIRAARARLSYETWYGIHLYVYLAMALGFLHQLTLGVDFVDDGLARASWIGLYAIAFVPLILFRFLEPLVRNLRHRFYVDQVVIERDGVASLWITGSAMEKLPSSSERALSAFFCAALSRMFSSTVASEMSR